MTCASEGTHTSTADAVQGKSQFGKDSAVDNPVCSLKSVSLTVRPECATIASVPDLSPSDLIAPFS